MAVKISIASDHAGFELKEYIKQNLTNVEFVDLGTHSSESVDYPDFGHKLAENIANKHTKLGILICGSGVGISIAANRNPSVRAALCHNKEIAKLSRQHNDANVLALGARFLENAEATRICQTFLETAFEGGRHTDRVAKLAC